MGMEEMWVLVWVWRVSEVWELIKEEWRAREPEVGW